MIMPEKVKDMNIWRRLKKKKSQISDHRDRDETEIEEGFSRLKKMVSENTVQVVKALITNTLLAIFVSGWTPQLLRTVLGIQEAVYISQIPKNAFTGLGFIFTVLIIVLLSAAEYKFFKSVEKDYVTDKKMNYDISKKNIYGSAHWQTEEEREACFYRSKDVEGLKNHLDILGFDDRKLLYTLRDDLHGLNKNIAIVGAPGAGKSAAIVKNHIYQNIRRGSSIIVTDSKGDIYRETAYIAKKHGYTVKVLNIKSDEIGNSDGCDLLKFVNYDPVKDETNASNAPVKAQVMANTIIRNTEADGKLDYWAKNEMNYLKALLLFIAKDPKRQENGTNSLAEVFNYSSTKTVEQIKQDFGMLKNEDPAKQAFNIFTQCDPKVQGQIANGMNIRLQTLGDPMVQKMVGSDEIDLTLPMKEKCLYYVIIPDMDDTYKFIATLFFSELFMQMGAYSDSLSKAEKKDQLSVSFILDEFYATGAMPDFKKYVATVRSRKMGITIILQDIGQLEEMYPGRGWNSIMNSMATKIYLSSNDPNTAKYFSDLLGIQTIRLENRGYIQDTGDVVNTHGKVKVSEGYGKRQLRSPDELMNNLSSDDLIVTISGHHPVMLHKFIADNHPMDRERYVEKKIRRINRRTGEETVKKELREQEMIPANHTPAWREALEENEQEKSRKEEELRREMENRDYSVTYDKHGPEKEPEDPGYDERPGDKADIPKNKPHYVTANGVYTAPGKKNEKKGRSGRKKDAATTETERDKIPEEPEKAPDEPVSFEDDGTEDAITVREEQFDLDPEELEAEFESDGYEDDDSLSEALMNMFGDGMTEA